MTAPTQDAAIRRASAAPSPAHAPEERRPRHLKVVPEGYRTRRARRRRARLLGFTAAVIVCAGLFGLVAAHVILTQGQLQIDRMTARAADEEARHERLRLQVARLEAPERVVAVAQSRLGMVPPPGVTYLSPHGVATDRVPASTVPRPLIASSPHTAPKPAATKPSATKTTAKVRANPTAPKSGTATTLPAATATKLPATSPPASRVARPTAPAPGR
jgi:cell division protein FtsL